MTRQTATEIEMEATKWLMRIDKEGFTPDLQEELETWMVGDRRRRGALLKAEATWLLLDRLGNTRSNQESGIGSASRSPTEGHPVKLAFGRRWILAGGGAAIAASLIGGAYLLDRPKMLGTSVGEIRHVPLEDGSVAAINTRSLLAVSFLRQRRLVRLVRGEAWFQVAKDRSRPFVVEAGDVRVQAVGTAFSVRLRKGGADVLVTEGIVEVWSTGAPERRTSLSAGARAFVAEDAHISTAPSSPIDVDRALAWRGGNIDLEGERLSEAVAEFNRYNSRQIIIMDPALDDERFYGVFRTDDPEGFALAVRSSLDVPVDASQPDSIRIGRPAS